MEACRQTVIQPNGINILPIDIKYQTDPTSVGVGIPQCYKRVKSVSLAREKQQQKNNKKNPTTITRGVNDDV
jgi:hypothetical protein